jgi:hypothetical protein
MGYWDARGTPPGVDDNDLLFHYERRAPVQYDIPAPNDTYIVTLYFANSFSGTAGTGRRGFHVYIEDVPQAGFEHCENSGKTITGRLLKNPFFGADSIYDPVDAAERLYSSNPCNFAACAPNGVVSTNDPDRDRIPASEECGNAAASALRYEVEITDGKISIGFTPPIPADGEPTSPDNNPKVSGISIKKKKTGPDKPVFHRGDSDGNKELQLTDAVRILGVLFLGQGVINCFDAADADDNGDLQLTDAVRILGVLFLGQGVIPAPGPTTEPCGPDPTDDALECAEYSC